MHWSPDGGKLLNDSDGVQSVCSTRTLQLIANINSDYDSLEFDPKSQFVYGKNDTQFSVWSASTGKQLFKTEWCDGSTR